MARILVVEDGKSMARILTHYLRKAGHTPIVTSTGEAVLHAAATQPDLILLHAERPDLPAAGVLGRLRRQLETAQIPVVLLAGESGPEVHVAASGAHAGAAVLRKPMLFPELCAVVDAVLNASVEPAPEIGTTTQQRMRLILRLITEGSDRLVRQICARLETDRRQPRKDLGNVTSWADIARGGCQEGLLSNEEGALLAACDLTVVETHGSSAESVTRCRSARAHRGEVYQC